MISYHMSIVHWCLKHWLHQNSQPDRKYKVSDEESSTHSPHQPQQVEGVQTGPLWHTGFAPHNYFHFLIDKILCPLDLASCVREIQSTSLIN